MKHYLMMRGQSLKDVKKFRHDLTKLWKEPDMVGFRALVYKQAEAAWNKAKESGLYEYDFTSVPSEMITEHICYLGRLHSDDSNYALRYGAQAAEQVPVPLLLLDTLQPVKDELAREYSRVTG